VTLLLVGFLFNHTLLFNLTCDKVGSRLGGFPGSADI